MLAAVYHGPEQLRVEECPVPSIAPDELLLQVEFASICATDLRILAGGHRMCPPGTVRIPGHEIVGRIAGIGAAVQGCEQGQRVFIAPNVGCGHCPQCLRGKNNLCPSYQAFGITLDGGFAEYMRVTAAAIRQGNVIPLAPDVDPAGAALAEPFACVLHGQEAVNVHGGDVVLIQGAGPIGLMHVLLARARGARRILVSDQAPERLAKARLLGAARVMNILEEDIARAVSEETAGVGADVVIVAAPSREAAEQAPQLAAAGGRINLFAGMPMQRPSITLDANLIHYKELILTGSTGSSTGDCRRALELVCSGAVDLLPLISGRYPLREAAAAFDAARSRSGLKIVFEPEVR